MHFCWGHCLKRVTKISMLYDLSANLARYPSSHRHRDNDISKKGLVHARANSSNWFISTAFGLDWELHTLSSIAMTQLHNSAV